MKRIVHIILTALPALILFSCGGVDQSEYDRLAAERDSIAAAAAQTATDAMQMQAYLGDIAACVDSISSQEQILTVKVDPETGRAYSRREIVDRIRAFADVISRQRERIAALTDSLNNGTGSSAQVERLTKMVAFLNSQLAAKEMEMHRLRQELATSKRSIDDLTRNVASLNETNAMLSGENEALDRTVAEQTERMNEGYFLAKTKKELEQMGILKGGFLKKTTFNAGNVNTSMCQKVDIRSFNEVSLTSKKPKLLSQAPASSYTFEKIDKDHYRLVILDTMDFWSLSNVVIIQL